MSDRNEQTKERVARWKTALQSADSGPLFIAAEVVATASQWGSEASFSSFLRAELGPRYSLKRFHIWADSVTKLGKEAKRTMSAEAAVWLAHAAPAERVEAIMSALFRFKRERCSGNVLSKNQVARVANRVLGRKAKQRPCGPCERCVMLDERCVMLESLLRKAGIEVPRFGEAA